MVISGIPHLEGLQLFSSMSKGNISNFLDKLPADARTVIDKELAMVENAFDLGYLQTDDGVTLKSGVVFVLLLRFYHS